MPGRISSRTVTMADIAKVTGLSKMTISRVLNHHPYVSSETRKKVETAMRKLGFQPNMLAKRFFTGKTQLIVVVAPIAYMFRSWYFKDLFQGVFERAEQAGYDILFHNSASQRRPAKEKCVELVKGRLAEGLLLVAPMIHDSYPAELTRMSVPLVVLGETACGSAVNRVLPPNREMAERMTRYLLDRGHRRIALLAFDDTHVESKERETGYRQAMTRVGFLDAELIVAARYDRIMAMHETRRLLKNNPDITAVFALNADMAIGAADAISSLGLRIPDDISLVVFDDGPEIEQWTPPLTAIRQKPFDIGYKGCDLLLNLVAQPFPRRLKPQTIVVEAELIERQSVKAIGQ